MPACSAGLSLLHLILAPVPLILLFHPRYLLFFHIVRIQLKGLKDCQD
ncbi:Uncharacterized protein dnm_022340 [Desulfonema magnum]|uniref:Uncharacterized protein n=1 Tax=Desulfonema magnum TaxID=45655 RepID=A0A975BIY9_9BACT|nr:Uncharacterized protein dnm_022340 [Desulfonema magnum]